MTLYRLPLAEPTPPRYRGDCLPGGSNEARPCRWSGCRHNTAGGCALDAADLGGVSVRDVASLLGLRRSEVEMAERRAFKKRNVKEALAPYRDHEASSGMSALAAAGESPSPESRKASAWDGSRARGPGESRFRYEVTTVRLALTKHAALRPAPKAFAARAWALYLAGAPCFADRACVLRAGHAGPCEAPDDIRRARAGEERARDRRVTE